MTGRGCQVHLTQAGEGPWSVPEQNNSNNPFGVFIRTPNVNELAARAEDLIIRPGGIVRHRELSLYKVGVCDPVGHLVRIGWPSRRMRTSQFNIATGAASWNMGRRSGKSFLASLNVCSSPGFSLLEMCRFLHDQVNGTGPWFACTRRLRNR